MNMMKGLLLGSAATLVVAAGAQAADLPVKAKPVEYVRICTLYGAGFYYMPGTDLCIKIGGWVRAEAAWGVNGSMTWGPFNANLNQRTTSNEVFRARGYITADVRNQTEYGTVRGYIAVGLNTNDVGLQVASLVDSANRAFVQWAGMTAGLAQSFYDFYSVPKYQYRGGYLPASDTGDGGWWVWAYTAQFGGGWSATLSAEARRMTQICDANALAANSCTVLAGSFTSAVAGAGALFPGVGAYGGMQSGDYVGNIRVDQAWGGAQIMGAAHDVNGSYYNIPLGAIAPSIPGTGHPGDKWGWVAGAGLLLNLPYFAQGDSFMGQVNYTQGALRYVFNTPGTTNYGIVNGANAAWGVMSDCVYGGTLVAGTTTGCNLTTAWGFNAAYEHYWTPAWHTSIYGAWAAVKYNSQANASLCFAEGNSIGVGGGSLAVAGANCNNNWSTWGVGSRTQWDVTKTFYLGVEVMYQQLQSASLSQSGTLVNAAGVSSPLVFGSALHSQSSASNWMVSVRAHRDFLP